MAAFVFRSAFVRAISVFRCADEVRMPVLCVANFRHLFAYRDRGGSPEQQGSEALHLRLMGSVFAVGEGRTLRPEHLKSSEKERHLQCGSVRMSPRLAFLTGR